MHLFLPSLLNYTLTIHFSEPLLCVMLICSDWSHFHPIWPVYLIKQCLFFPLQKQHLVAKNEFAFSFRPTRKDQQVGGNMLMFDVHVNMKSLGVVLKMTRFNDSKSILYLRD